MAEKSRFFYPLFKSTKNRKMMYSSPRSNFSSLRRVEQASRWVVRGLEVTSVKTHAGCHSVAVGRLRLKVG
jgi:hypothetical protein